MGINVIEVLLLQTYPLNICLNLLGGGSMFILQICNVHSGHGHLSLSSSLWVSLVTCILGRLLHFCWLIPVSS